MYYTSFFGAEQRLFEYIELFYNRKRIHSTIGYVSPHQYERMYYNSHVQAVS
ncbi:MULTISPECIES: IS3 family transposase [Pelotomaculum]|uniref:IS3 family transposase n=1 Tax=Pelotomaculum TaxID=191373 RepID=UPI00257F426E|nr:MULTISPECIES: IS3 family transposase [Pelotomaculum]